MCVYKYLWCRYVAMWIESIHVENPFVSELDHRLNMEAIYGTTQMQKKRREIIDKIYYGQVTCKKTSINIGVDC